MSTTSIIFFFLAFIAMDSNPEFAFVFFLIGLAQLDADDPK